VKKFILGSIVISTLFLSGCDDNSNTTQEEVAKYQLEQIKSFEAEKALRDAAITAKADRVSAEIRAEYEALLERESSTSK